MKKKLFNWLYLLVAVVMCVGFASCSEEEGNKGTLDSNVSLVGTWEYTTGSDFLIATFNADGTGTLTEYDNGNVDIDAFKWVLSKNDKLIITDENGDTEIYDLVIIDENKILCEMDGKNITWTRQAETSEATSLAGTWKWTFGSGYILATFKEDGSGAMMEYDNGGVDYAYKFEWVLIGGEKLIITHDDSDTDVYELVIINENKILCNIDNESGYWQRQTETSEEINPAGTWKWTFGNGYIIATFSTNGSGVIKGYNSGIMDYAYNFEWFLVGGDNLIITDQYGSTELYELTVIDENRILCNMDDENIIWDRQSSGQDDDEVSFAGTWRHNFSGGYSLFVINENGRGTYIEYNNGQKTDEDGCTWNLDGNKLTIIYDDDVNDIDVDVYTVTFVSNDIVWLTDIDSSSDSEPQVWYRQ